MGGKDGFGFNNIIIYSYLIMIFILIFTCIYIYRKVSVLIVCCLVFVGLRSYNCPISLPWVQPVESN